MKSFALHNIAGNRNLNVGGVSAFQNNRVGENYSGETKCGLPKFLESHPQKLFLASRGTKSHHVRVSESCKRELVLVNLGRTWEE